MLVRERMSHPVITVYPETSMQEAVELMTREHVRRLPVVNKRGKLLGIVTENDVNRALPSDATTLSKWEMHELINKVKVQEIMTEQVVQIEEDTPIEEAARIMADCKISGLPVMRDGKLVGMITETDLFKIFLELFSARDKGVRITVEVPRGPGQIAKLSKVIHEKGGDILSMGTYLGESTDTGHIILKVEGVQKEDLISAIEPQVLRITDVRVIE
ncbi:MAG: CBS domain-containing protein [Chloroflexi bacterium]|nr:CBS domain-containing protein [Chloroflexota bacterium]